MQQILQENTHAEVRFANVMIFTYIFHGFAKIIVIPICKT